MCIKKVIEILVASLKMKKLNFERLKIRAKLVESAQTITDELVLANGY